ncbi:hypothetical protein Y032_0004g1902 [Ancylostoma ceylanicum]|uniref:Uncharacterized protein n=1 Tax=Ancylostoma ceylanicum TaxID=53326 RepID=A0A016VTW3_9BILA|nr:hypothetical protein Y032_0004g1902 [Ancylostoma ceylanicum]
MEAVKIRRRTPEINSKDEQLEALRLISQFRDFSCTLPDSAQRGGSECANTSMRFRRSSVYCERSGSAAPILCQTLKDSNEQV